MAQTSFFDVCDTASFPTLSYNLLMVRLRRFYDANHLHFLTTSTYRHARVFDSDRFKRKFIISLGDLRVELGFRNATRRVCADIQRRCLRHPVAQPRIRS